MKNRGIFVLSLLSLSLLTSCNNVTSLSIDEINNYVSSLNDVTYDTYSYVGRGNGLDIEVDISANNATLSETDTSVFAMLPLKLQEEGFYEVDKDGNIISSCTYFQIYSRVVDSSSGAGNGVFGSRITDEGYLEFYTFNAFNTLSVNNVNLQPVSVSARFNISYIYNKDGYLVYELIESANYGKDDNSRTYHLECEYTYA